MVAITPNGNQKTAHARIRRAIALTQFESASERFALFGKVRRRLSRKRNGIDPARMRAVLLDRLKVWTREVELAGGFGRAHRIEEIEEAQVHRGLQEGDVDGTSQTLTSAPLRSKVRARSIPKTIRGRRG